MRQTGHKRRITHTPTASRSLPRHAATVSPLGPENLTGYSRGPIVSLSPPFPPKKKERKKMEPKRTCICVLAWDRYRVRNGDLLGAYDNDGGKGKLWINFGLVAGNKDSFLAK